MLTQIKEKRSLTFYQTTTTSSDQSQHLKGLYAAPLSAHTSATAHVARNIISHTAETVNTINTNAASVIAGYNKQLSSYLSYITKTQNVLTKQAQTYVSNILAQNPNASASVLRDTNSFSHKVKPFVVRQEMMKLQIGGDTAIPVSPKSVKDIASKLQGKDLTAISDKELNDIISGIVSTQSKYADMYINALKDFQATGKVSNLLQADKLSELSIELKTVDLSKLTSNEFRRLVKNFCEVNEFHHRTSISSDPYLQNNADNIDVLSTSQHDAIHGNRNYRKPLNAPPLDRRGELKAYNKKRTAEVKRNTEDAIKSARTEGKRQLFNNELQGIAVAATIGLLAGFTIGFSASLAQNGVSPDSFKRAFIAGSKTSLSAGVQSVIGYSVGRTLGEVATKALTGVLENVGLKITENISKMCNMASVGVITILLTCTIQFISLAHQGVPLKKVAVQVGKQALVSLSLLGIAIVAQGIWGGPAGIIVSISTGIIVVVYSTADMVHQRQLSERVRVYLIEKCKPEVFKLA